MCGIVGIITSNADKVSISVLKTMTNTIVHRGPDGEGHWIAENKKVGLGFRRLSIIDLSHVSDQPMHYLDRLSIVFNGEIYNYLELKEFLLSKGYVFHTKSDTEVLLALYHFYGKDCLQYIDGMFAFVIFDKLTNHLFCARDRFGEKPFYYAYKQGEFFYFASEMKALWAAGISKEVNNEMLFNYLSFDSIENPEKLSDTFYSHCIKLEHSHYLMLDIDKISFTKHQYYTIDYTAIDRNISESTAKEKLENLLLTSVKRRLRSDVAIGSSLSGGLDSSTIVCLIEKLKSNKNQRQETFSAIFPGYKKDEKKFIDEIHEKVNVHGHFVQPSAEGFINDFDKLIWHQEEPFVSSSIYAQFCVMQLARKNNVTVLLDGQGADEIFAGYHHYFNYFFDELKRNNPKVYKNQKAAYLNLHSNNLVNSLAQKGLKDYLKSISPNLIVPIKKLKAKISQTQNPILNQDFFKSNVSKTYMANDITSNSLNAALHANTLNTGLQKLLRYADRNSMANSVEVRLPFLNHELVDFLFSLPSTFKINNGWTKWILRETFAHLLPKEISWRLDKIGFETPQNTWMESSIMKEKIWDLKKDLVQNQILNKAILDNKFKSPQNLDWQILMSSIFHG